MGSNTLDGSLETFSVQKVFQNKEGVEEEARERFLQEPNAFSEHEHLFRFT